MGIELRSLGVNVSFAPLFDIDSNPSNRVIGRRAFATSSDGVITAAEAFIAALQGQGVVACPKHFPGHGGTVEDSHYDLPVVASTIEELRDRELLPYRALLHKGVRILMTAHILFPAIDATVPATMSRILLDEVLRKELGYDGVVISDDIGMGAISDRFNHADATFAAINAGCDLLMICAKWTDTARAFQVAENIISGLVRRHIDRRTYDRSAERIDSLLSALPHNTTESLPVHVFAEHSVVAPLFVREQIKPDAGSTCVNE
jgi:beta-N-acetylhexosaminidase